MWNGDTRWRQSTVDRTIDVCSKFDPISGSVDANKPMCICLWIRQINLKIDYIVLLNADDYLMRKSYNQMFKRWWISTELIDSENMMWKNWRYKSETRT